MASRAACRRARFFVCISDVIEGHSSRILSQTSEAKNEFLDAWSRLCMEEELSDELTPKVVEPCTVVGLSCFLSY